MNFLYMDFVSATESPNPHDIIDGGWGGFGPQIWFMFPHIHPRNVFERSFEGWGRVWDDDMKCWRDVTFDELDYLPEIKKPKPFVISDFTKYVAPVILNMPGVPILCDLVSVQPMVSS